MILFEAVKKTAAAFKLEWPVELKLTNEGHDSLKTVEGVHTVSISPETEESYLYEIFAGAKLGELYSEPLLSSLEFEDEEDERAVSFIQSSYPILYVQTHRVMREYLSKEDYGREIAFLKEIFEQGRNIEQKELTPFFFFAIYLALQDAGEDVGPIPKRSKSLESMMALFDGWLAEPPSAELLCRCYNYFLVPGAERASISENRKIKFA